MGQRPKERRPSPGDRAADAFARTVGSWRFIGIQSAILVAWLGLNAVAWVGRWDPYPFILLNLMLSFQAAYAAPIIMMSQNRADRLDRLAAQHDYAVNEQAAAEVEEMLVLLHAQLALLEELHVRLVQSDDRSGRPE